MRINRLTVIRNLLAVCIITLFMPSQSTFANAIGGARNIQQVQENSTKDDDLLREVITSGEWEYYNLDDGTIAIRGYKNEETDLVIPATLDEKKVSAIAAFAFRDCTNLKSIMIPFGITNIGGCAFQGCNNLTSLVLPESVVSIGSSAFEGCSSLTTITLPEYVTSIADSVFKGCSSLTSVTLPKGTTDIGLFFFYGCTSLTEVIIPEGVTHIGEFAFDECGNLSGIRFPDSLNDIDKYAFSRCVGLKGVVIPTGVKTIGMGAFSHCENMASVILSDGVTTIGDSAFYGCSQLQTITIPDSVSSLGRDAFYHCTGLESIFLSGGMKKIEDDTFFDCSNLERVVIPEGITDIGERAFYDCSQLQSISLPLSLKIIEKWAFNETAISTVKYAGTQNQWENINIDVKGNVVICDADKIDADGNVFKSSADEYNRFHKPYPPMFKGVKNDEKGILLTWENEALKFYRTCIYRSVNGGKYKMIYRTSNWYEEEFTDKDVTDGTKYEYKIASYCEDKTGAYTSDETASRTIYRLSQPKISNAKCVGGENVSFSWKKNSKASGYEIQSSLNDNFSGEKSTKLNKASKVKATVKKLKKGKTYYVRVRAYKTVGGRTFTSAWSAKKKVKIK